jgi:glycosyltransferase involved in cell wall biosynthesis
MIEDRCVDLLYLACNRLEFTRETFTTLVATTDWRFIHELFVYDDGSRDGTRAWLAQAVGSVPAPVRLVHTRFGSPVSAMGHFITSASAPMLAKTDNDAMLPPGWLRQSLDVFDRHPELSLLGIEAMYPHMDDPALPRSYTPAQFISGLGLYRRDAFRHGVPRTIRKWFGLEEWQMARGPGLVRGWITPALPVFLLDRVPFEPWRSYGDEYVRRGWQRSWPKYDPTGSLWRWRWPDPAAAAAASPDGLARCEAGVSQQPASAAMTPALPSGDPRFLCALRIKNEAAHIHEVITSVLPLCGRVFVFDDNSTDDTVAICRSFGARVTVFSSPFVGLDETRDKNWLLARTGCWPGSWRRGRTGCCGSTVMKCWSIPVRR